MLWLLWLLWQPAIWIGMGVRVGGGGIGDTTPPVGGYTPKLDFSDARNSMYVGLL